jgi:Tfp pilus assembly protein PilV
MRTTRRRILGQRGISMMETMVALGLFVISAATTSDFLVRQIRQTSQNNLYTVAYAVAEEHLESVRAARYPDMLPSSDQVQKGDVVFDVSTSVETNVPAPNLKQITVQVAWNEPGGRRDVEVQTIYTAVRRF